MSETFYQQGPRLSNTFHADPHLKRMLTFFLQKPLPAHWQEILHEFGEDASGRLLEWSQQAEAEAPVHVPFDPWGRRIDQLKISSGWTKIERYAAENALIATGYQRRDGPHSRLLQMAMLYLFHPSSAFVSCPLAMTDGAARALEVYGDLPEHKNAFKNLISVDPDQSWFSGQWMTEKAGGSDVGQTETRAKKTENEFHLYGTKWFTSATTSQMAITLARPEGAEAGSRGLSLFYVRLRDSDGALRRIQILRLKNKLGTDALPTAELELLGTPATLIGGEGHGVRKIATLFNVTRIYNAICSIGTVQRGLQLAGDYANRRKVFGHQLVDQPLHRVTFSELLTEKAACSILTFRTAELWGREEVGTATQEDSALLRLYTTLAKLYTGKRAVQMTSEIIEMFGGAGYVEDTGLPRLLRDAQVFPIWEGTTNVLSLDVMRALSKECPFELIEKDVYDRLSRLSGGRGAEEKRAISEQIQNLARWMSSAGKNQELFLLNARDFAFELSQIVIKSLLVEMAAKTENRFDIEVAKRFCQRPAWKPATAETKISVQTLFADMNSQEGLQEGDLG